MAFSYHEPTSTVDLDQLGAAIIVDMPHAYIVVVDQQHTYALPDDKQRTVRISGQQ